MKKRIMDLRVISAERVGGTSAVLWLSPLEGLLPEIRPGQFAQLRVDAPGVFLRRPISIHDVDTERNAVALLVQVVGEGTNWLARLKAGNVLNAVMPLGNGFAIPGKGAQVLLVGGGVGVAPLLYQGRILRERGIAFSFLLGAKTKDMLLQLDEFRRVGPVFITTEDGSEGERGFVTQHSLFSASCSRLSIIQACGPTPMMKAVARLARKHGIRCQVSLENSMACGVGACLCCVQQTLDGHKCTCTDGPVFEAEQLKWE